MNLLVISCLGLFFAVCGMTMSANADVLILKNGDRFTGKVVEKTDETIKFDFHGVMVSYPIEDIEAIEKEIPAVIVKDEESKQKLKEKLLKEGKVDRVYEVHQKKITSSDQAQETVRSQQRRTQQLDAPAQPQQNVGIQFGSINDWAQEEEQRLRNMSPAEREAYEKQKAAAERFYNER